MTAQPSLFDVAEGMRRRDAGKARAASAWSAWLEEARAVAYGLALQHGQVTADNVRAAGVSIPEGASPNIMGSLFNDSRFVFAGFAYSARPEAHRNLLRVWRLATDAARRT